MARRLSKREVLRLTAQAFGPCAYGWVKGEGWTTACGQRRFVDSTRNTCTGMVCRHCGREIAITRPRG